MTGVIPVKLSTPGAEIVLSASIVQLYERETIARETDTPTIRNFAHKIFSTIPQASRVAVVMTSSMVMLLLFELAGKWFDVKCNPVVLKRAN